MICSHMYNEVVIALVGAMRYICSTDQRFMFLGIQYLGMYHDALVTVWASQELGEPVKCGELVIAVLAHAHFGDASNFACSLFSDEVDQEGMSHINSSNVDESAFFRWEPRRVTYLR